MEEDFKPGDRIKVRNGESGTIIRVDGGIAHVQLDSSVRKSVATAALRKVENCDEGPLGQSN